MSRHAGSKAAELVLDLPLLHSTPVTWARLAAAQLPLFLADHAVCEQQAALFALNLIAHYPEDEELVDKMTSLAIEEVTHLRRVTALLRQRGHGPAGRRSNPYVQGLHRRISRNREAQFKLDRLLVGALIEARSCERFSCLLAEIHDEDPEVARLLFDLGPAEQRHWKLFHGLARREVCAPELEACWARWLAWEAELARGLGRSPTVHG